MALSDSEYLAWLQSEDKDPVVLVYVGYYNPVWGSGELYISDKGYVDPTNIAIANHLPVIVGDIVIEDSIDSSIISAIEFLNYDNTLQNFQFIGWPCIVRFGDRSWPYGDFRQEAYNRISNFTSPSPDKYRLEFSDLKVPYFDQLITGASQGLTVGLPFVFGKVFNMLPLRVLDDKYSYFTPGVSNIPYEVRDRGVPLTTPADYTCTITPDVTGDGLRVDIVFAVAPSGEITADIGQPNTGVNSFATLADIMSQLTYYTDVGGISPSDTVENFTGDLGYVLYNPTSVGEMLNEMCSTLGINPRVNNLGELEVVQISDGGTSQRDVYDANLLKPLEIISKEPPYKALNIGYQKNWNLQTSNLVNSLTEAEYALYAADFSYLSSVRSLPAYPFLKTEKQNTLFYLQTDAQDELDRRFALRDTERTRWKVEGDASFIYDRIGSTITMYSADFDLSLGADFVVISNSKNLSALTCSLTVWK